METLENPRKLRLLPYCLGGILGLALALIVISGVLFYRASRGSENASAQATTVVAASDDRAADSGAIEQSRRNAIVVATERVSPAVVTIASKHKQVVRRYPFANPFARDWLNQFFRMPETYLKEYSNLGSGVIIDDDGYILTNNHVVQGAELIEVTVSDGRVLEGRIIGAAPDYDLALVKIEGGKFPAASMGNSDELLVGEWAIAIGSPFGQLLADTQPTVTVGVISAVHRDVKSDNQNVIFDMIQTDAAINPGNSGGPLIDSRGNVIGINSSIISPNGGGSIGMGFAIPINRGKWVLEEIREHGRVRSVWVGVTVEQVTPQAAAVMGLSRDRGLLVAQLELESPAHKAGMKPGDIITAVNGSKISTTAEANRLIFGAKIGERIEFEVARGNEIKRFTVVLAEKPNEI
jgi:serine protease Do